MSAPTQLAFDGMAPPTPPAKVRRLADLYWEACCSYYGPIAERLAADLAARGELGDDGLTEQDMRGVPPFVGLDEFAAQLDAAGVGYRA